jgi:hypothetical protein
MQKRYVRNDLGARVSLLATIALLVACGQRGTTPDPPPPGPSPSPPAPPSGISLLLDDASKRFVVSNVRTGTTVRLSVAVSNLTASLYTSLRVALVVRATGMAPGLGPLDLQVGQAPSLSCSVTPIAHVAAPNAYGWSVEYDVDPRTGNPAFDLAGGSVRGPVCVEIRFARAGVTAAGVTLEGHVFAYRDINPADGRYDIGGDAILSRPPAGNPLDVTLNQVAFIP